MRTKILSKIELVNFVSSLIPSHVVAILLGGDRMSCCDEAVAIIDENDVICGVATIAPNGEENSGEPTLVAIYVLPKFRRMRFAKVLFEKAVERFVERKLIPFRVDVLSQRVMQIIHSLPAETRSLIKVVDMGSVMDPIADLEKA